MQPSSDGTVDGPRSSIANDLVGEFAEGARAVRKLASSGVDELSWGSVRAVIAMLVFAAIAVLDAWTTVSMMNTGLFEEANPVADLGMRTFGLLPYVLVASIITMSGGVLAAGKPRGLYATTAWVSVAFLAVYKAWVGVSNYLLWQA